MSVFQNRIDSFKETYNALRENDRYYYLQQIDELDGARVHMGGRRMVMFSSYSYLGLLKHPRCGTRQTGPRPFRLRTHGVESSPEPPQACQVRDQLAEFLDTRMQ